MARPLRLEFSGAVYHLTSRGNARQKIFFNDGRFKAILVKRDAYLLELLRRVSLKDLLKRIAVNAGLSADTLTRKGRLATVVNARDQFIHEAVLDQGYLASQVAEFL